LRYKRSADIQSLRDCALRQSLIPWLKDGLIAVNTRGAGETLPQPRVHVQGYDDVLLDDLTGPGLRIIAAADATAGETSALAAAVVRSVGRR
jgi:hypothetical protein